MRRSYGSKIGDVGTNSLRALQNAIPIWQGKFLV